MSYRTAAWLDQSFTISQIKAEDRLRVCLIEGPPTVRELAATQLQIIPFTKVFRPNKLVDRALPNSTSPPPSTWAGVTSIPPAPSASPIIVKNGVVKKPTPKPSWQPGPRGYDPTINVNAAVSYHHDPDTISSLRRNGRLTFINGRYLTILNAEQETTNYAIITISVVLVQKPTSAALSIIIKPPMRI